MNVNAFATVAHRANTIKNNQPKTNPIGNK